MQLSHDQIRAITRGAVAFEPDGNALGLCRFTAEQRQTYRALNEGFYTRASCTAGVRFDFRTDSTTFAMSWLHGPRSSRICLSIDLYVDGVMLDTYVDDSFVDDEGGSCRFVLPAGDKRVTVYLPYTVQLIPTCVELDDGATITPVIPARRLLTLGDSITQGYHAQYSSQSYACNVARYFDFDQINQGVAGANHTAPALQPIEGWQPDIITTAFGTNDWGHCKDYDEFEQGVRAYFDRLRTIWPDTPVLAILPIWRADCHKPRATGDFFEVCGKFREIIESYPNIRILDGMTAVPHKRNFFGDCRLHPNDLGFIHYSLAVIRELSQML